jgi:4-amino-4-deoxy-L-arabinose transferase-like glycosyltransferase
MTASAVGDAVAPVKARGRFAGAAVASRHAVARHWLEAAIVVAITLVAGYIRMYQLLDYPAGFHGDEGLSGWDAQNVLDHGWIGPYLPSSVGYPAGYAYWTAAVVKFAGNDAWGVRLAPALLGTLTIPIGYVAFRIMFGYRVAVIAAVFLATSAWHILYSRVAFLPIAWPFVEAVTTIPLFLAVRTRGWYYFAATGACAGVGVYSYGSYPIFLAALAVFLVWLAIRDYGLSHTFEFVRNMGLVAAGFYVAAFSMIQYIADPDNNYFQRARSLSITKTPSWQDAGASEHLHMVLNAARDWLEIMTWRGVPDRVDAAGFGPMLDKYTVALAAAGLVLLLLHWRRLPNFFVLAVLLLVPFGAILTVDGSYRRALGILPFLAVAMALPLARLWEWADAKPAALRAVACGIIVGAVAVVGVTNVRYYFGTLSVSQSARYIYVEDLAAASRYLHDRNPEYVYFLANRWEYKYPTRAFLAPNVPGEDRSAEFGTSHRIDLSADRTKDAVFILLGIYTAPQVVSDLRRRYPQGTPYNGLSDDGHLLFVAFAVPHDPDAVSTGPTTYACEAGNCTCIDFPSHAEAQRTFDKHGGSPTSNWSTLDGDHDGIACESLR